MDKSDMIRTQGENAGIQRTVNYAAGPLGHLPKEDIYPIINCNVTFKAYYL